MASCRWKKLAKREARKQGMWISGSTKNVRRLNWRAAQRLVVRGPSRIELSWEEMEARRRRQSGDRHRY